MSALDLFASAMGAFALIAVVLFPYYLNNSDAVQAMNKIKDQLKQCKAENQSQKSEIGRLQQQAQQQAASLAQCKEKLKKTFLAVVIKWPTKKHDVDLYITDPSGAVFSYKHKTISGRTGELSTDTQSGPGIEIWEINNPPAGKYLISYELYNRHGNNSDAVVYGGVYHRDGHDKLKTVKLSRKGDKVLIATITVSDDGNVTIRN